MFTSDLTFVLTHRRFGALVHNHDGYTLITTGYSTVGFVLEQLIRRAAVALRGLDRGEATQPWRLAPGDDGGFPSGPLIPKDDEE